MQYHLSNEYNGVVRSFLKIKIRLHFLHLIIQRSEAYTLCLTTISWITISSDFLQTKTLLSINIFSYV